MLQEADKAEREGDGGQETAREDMEAVVKSEGASTTTAEGLTLRETDRSPAPVPAPAASAMTSDEAEGKGKEEMGEPQMQPQGKSQGDLQDATDADGDDGGDPPTYKDRSPPESQFSPDDGAVATETAPSSSMTATTAAPSTASHAHHHHHHPHHHHVHHRPPTAHESAAGSAPKQQSQPPPPSATPSMAMMAAAVAAGGSAPSQTTPAQEQHAAQDLAGAAGLNSPYRPLNVRDALQYLDTVKSTFGDSDNVYAMFLSCMREFKSQAIDTPQVIARVSTLFRGHVELIRGFNTFLPPGYRIESRDPYDPNIITVTTPMGTTTQSTGDVNMLSKINAGQSAGAESGYYANEGYPPGHAPAMAHLQAAANTSNRGSWRAPVEFNHAMSFVNKIKTRFQGDSDIYRKFLTILQMYQKEECDISEVYLQVMILFTGAPDLLEEFRQFLPDASGNAAPSGGLFGILSTSAAGQTPSQAALVGNERGPMDDGRPGRMPPMGSFAPPGHGDADPRPVKKPSSGKKKKSAAGPAGMEGKMGSSASSKELKRPRTGRSPPPPAPQSSGTYGASPPPPPPPMAPGLAGVPAGASTLMPPATLPSAVPSFPPGTKPIATADEMTFFDRVKKFVDDRAVFAEFLKLCNLYSQDIIDQRTVVERARTFIGGSQELFTWFINFVGYDPNVLGATFDGEDFVINNVPALLRPRVDLNQCKAYGPSYRKLPKSEASLACSGRDAMCWEVLNDEWVSHPTWASEDAGFVAHKKNIYEEALHKCEEERYEYDYHIEANLRTICWLEPIAHRIAAMTTEERAGFKLRSAFSASGGRSIYIRVIKKVYGPERGQEIIAALQDNPCVAVPVVLRRLKQKDGEWKRSQREWERVWREIDAKNFYKSLDHAGTSFKAADKKLLASKALVAEIEALKKEGKEAPLVNGGILSPRYQYDFDFANVNVLKDVVRLLFTHIEHAAGHSASDKERADTFLRRFLSVFFGFEKEEIDLLAPRVEENSNEGELDGASDMDGMSDAGSVDDQSSRDGSTMGRRNGATTAADLRRRLLKNTASRARATSSIPDTPATGHSTAVSPQPEAEGNDSIADEESARNEMDVDIGKAAAEPPAVDAGDTEMKIDATDPLPEGGAAAAGESQADTAGLSMERTLEPSAPDAKSWIKVQSPEETTVTKSDTQGNAFVKMNMTMFMSTGFYVALRLIRILYERLLEMRTESDNLANHSAETSRVNAIAVNLGLQNPNVDLLQGDKYGRLIELATKLIEGEVEQTTFEESVRFVFGIRAYKAFTFDKVVQNIMKHISLLANEGRSSKLMALAEDFRRTPTLRNKLVSTHRKAAERLIGAEEMIFRIDWIENIRHLIIQLLDHGTQSSGAALSDAAESQWATYVANYTAEGPTEGVVSPTRPPFLKRVALPGDALGSVKSDEKIKVKIAFDSYRMFYIPGGHDTVIRKERPSSSKDDAASTRQKLDDWLDKDERWSVGMSREEKEAAIKGMEEMR